MPRAPRPLLATMLTVALSGAAVAACSGPNPYQAAREATTTTAAAPGAGSGSGGATAVGDNEFLPDRNVSDCVGTLERPNCGSDKKGGLQMFLVFTVLILGLAFILWRISVGVRRRDAVVNDVPADRAWERPSGE